MEMRLEGAMGWGIEELKGFDHGLWGVLLLLPLGMEV